MYMHKGKNNQLFFIPVFILFFTGCSKEVFITDTIKDIDGNVYKTVIIGDQEWMAENLKTTVYADGNNIPNNRNGYFYYMDSKSYGDIYGALYTWNAAMKGGGSSLLNPSGVQGVCPDGWHLPSEDEWKDMILFLGGEVVAGGKMKAKGTTYWKAPNTGATNESGFSALPAGFYFPPVDYNSSGHFIALGSGAGWWTSSAGPFPEGAISKNINAESAAITDASNGQSFGLSVRCVKNRNGNTVPEVSSEEPGFITDVTIVCGGIISSSGGSNIIDYGICWNTDSIDLNISNSYHNSVDTLTNGKFVSIINNLIPGTKYFLRAFSTNDAGTGYGKILSVSTIKCESTISFNQSVEYGEFSDQDGNIYKTIKIGSQVWMAENLKSISSRDGRALTYYFADESKNPGITWYDNNIENKSDYGFLYSRNLIYNSSKICPSGWHIPSLNEWEILISYLGGWENAGRKLKEESSSHWMLQAEGTTNESGFTALPGGYYNNFDNYKNLGYFGYYFTSDMSYHREAGVDILYNWLIIFQNDSHVVQKIYDRGSYYSSVKCIKD